MKNRHSFNFHILNYQVCSKCGLITLKNKATEKAMKKPCKGSETEDKQSHKIK